jgi:hypothetical protein
MTFSYILGVRPVIMALLFFLCINFLIWGHKVNSYLIFLMTTLRVSSEKMQQKKQGYLLLTCLSIAKKTKLVRVTPRYFILFVFNCEGCCFPNWFLNSFRLWVAEGYWLELILYPAILLKLFISCSFVVEILGWLIHTIISSANSHILISSFPICIPLMSFCCLIALARTLSIYIK